MSDVEVIDRAEIVRREVDRESTERALAVIDPATLDAVFSSRDAGVIVQRIADISTVLMDAVHQRDLARTYGDSKNEFLHIEAWEFLSSMLGMTAVGVDSRKLPDGSGYEATAELRHIATGRVVGRADGMCERTEPGKAKAPNNTLRQMAQLRARRAAARSVLGFVPRIGGFEISDPDAPATNDQVAVLHILEREIGWDHDQGHVEAGDVASYRDLTREQASEVIERWTALRDDVQGGGGDHTSVAGYPAGPPASRRSPEPNEKSDAVSHFPASDAGESGSSPEQGTPEDKATLAYGEGAASTSSGAPDLDELWHQAIAAGLTTKKVVPFAKANGITVNAAYELDAEQMTVLLAKWRERK